LRPGASVGSGVGGGVGDGVRSTPSCWAASRANAAMAITGAARFTRERSTANDRAGLGTDRVIPRGAWRARGSAATAVLRRRNAGADARAARAARACEVVRLRGAVRARDDPALVDGGQYRRSPTNCGPGTCGDAGRGELGLSGSHHQGRGRTASSSGATGSRGRSSPIVHRRDHQSLENRPSVCAKGPERSRQRGRARPVPVVWSGSVPGQLKLLLVRVTPGGLAPIEL
jgi:hypothetical protein